VKRWKRWARKQDRLAEILPKKKKLSDPVIERETSKAQKEETTKKTAIHEVSDNRSTCSIWLAPSSVRDVKGMGVYTTRDILKGDDLLKGPDGPSILVVDYHLNVEGRDSTREKWIELWDEYWWGRGVADHVTFQAHQVMDYQITFGSLPNHHCILDTLTHDYPDDAYDETMSGGKQDGPQHGAFSYQRGRKFRASRDIDEGEEIFLNYGYCDRDPEDEVDPGNWKTAVRMPDDYRKASQIALDIWRKIKDNDEVGDDDPVELVNKDEIDERVLSLLPDTKAQMRDIVSEAQSWSDIEVKLARTIDSTPRTSNWIKENGLCLENLVPGQSVIDHAGQGGFSQNIIKMGEIVVPAPMLHIVDRDLLLMTSEVPETRKYQLLLNYCFGHRETPILLCPDTNAILVNHCSSRKKQCGQKGPNADFRWSSGWDPNSDKWKKRSLDRIEDELTYPGLSMEIYALRDIQPGEEVYIDYGAEWEDAWESHVANWVPPVREQSFVTAKEANQQIDLEILVSPENLRSVPTNKYLMTFCQYWPTSDDDHEVWSHQTERDWILWEDEELFSTFSDDGSKYEGEYSTHSDMTYWPCTVISGENGTYKVRILQHKRTRQQPWDRSGHPRLLTNYPRSSIQYFVKPYEGDQHFSGAFRHPIGIKDSMLPEKWKKRAGDKL